MKSRDSRWWIPFCGVLFALAASSCGRSIGDLKGKITYQGQPVCSGSIQVVGSDGIRSGKIEPDGRYHVKGIAGGTVKVIVNSPDPGMQDQLPGRKGVHAPPAAKDNSKWFPIPEDCGDLNKTPLTYELKAGMNTWNIELK